MDDDDDDDDDDERVERFDSTTLETCLLTHSFTHSHPLVHSFADSLLIHSFTDSLTL